MKALIVYASSGGTSKKCAEYLSSKLPGSEIKDIASGAPDMTLYDTLIIGGGIYAGKYNGKLRKFIKKNEKAILEKNHAFYLCCLDPEPEKYLVKNLSKEMTSTALATDGFGGETEPDRAKGINKMMLKMMKNINVKKGLPAPEVSKEKMDRFIDKVLAFKK
jgi:menaquinone-dependent protoporphyrinogen oxidase